MCHVVEGRPNLGLTSTNAEMIFLKSAQKKSHQTLNHTKERPFFYIRTPIDSQASVLKINKFNDFIQQNDLPFLPSYISFPTYLSSTTSTW